MSAPENRESRPPRRVGRRAFLAGVGASVAALVVTTGGQSFDLLAPFNAFAPRVKRAGPQDLPINRTARQAGVVAAAADPNWRLTVSGPRSTVLLSLSELRAMPQQEARLPIACVEGWSTTADWGGVPLSALAKLVGGTAGHGATVTSLQRSGPYRETRMGPEFVWDPSTLVALDLNGGPLDLDHGHPARIIAPGRPGVLQTKWLSQIEVH